jgi:transcription elongation factor Elf1
MAIRFACPVCKTPYTVDDRDAGKKADCKKCGQRLQVPSPPRLKTVLGEVIPDTDSARPSGTPPRPAMGRLEPGPSPTASPGSPAAGAGPIRFECPGCGAAYTVNQVSAGKSMDCRSCGQTMTVPGALGYRDESRPPPRPAALPVAPFDEREEPAPPPDPEPEPDPYISYPRARRAPNGPANRVVAGIGAGLLFIGLFLPMIHGPFGFWMSFIDFPWKAITVGFAIADEIKNAEPRRDRDPAPPRDPTPPTDRRDSDRGKAAKEPDGSALAVLVVIGSVLYPIFILAVLAFTGFQIAYDRAAASYLFAGVCCAGATLLYGLAILMLNAVQELRLVMAMLSPGFGWAVLFVGSFMLMVSGVIRPARQE